MATRDKRPDWKGKIATIRDLWLAAPRPGASLYDQPRNVLRRETYSLAKEMIDALKENEALKVLDDLRIDDVFRAIVSLVVTADEISREEQTRYACELEYARRHRMPPELLIGFILQVNLGKDIKKRILDADAYEPWYRPGWKIDWCEM